MADILIVDDDAALREALVEAVQDLGYGAREAGYGATALAMIEAGGIGGVLLDLRMPGMDGLEVLRRIRSRETPPPVVILTAHATAENTIEAMRLGAYDHLTKPIGQTDLKRVLTGMRAQGANPTMGQAESETHAFVGSSEAMRAIQKTIGLIADSDATTLVTGETGTGKELVARAIHDHGRRKAAAFIAVNCAAIPRDLLESELFGHVKGAFTGATTDRAGAFGTAHRGTLFLDEIGDMDLSMQAKILRVLQERVVTPVGGKPTPVDVRIVAATHRTLEALVAEGKFRQDLFYRLNVVPIHIPPLRERIADIVPLAEHFLRASGGPALSADAAAILVAYPWAGNVRELRNAMKRVSVLVRSARLAASDLAFLQPASLAGSGATDWPDDLPSAIAQLEEMLIRRALQRSRGNRTEAARLLNIRRQFLYAKLERYGFDVSDEGTSSVR